MSKIEEYISRSEQVILHTYNRFPVVLEKGDGVYLTDVKEKNIWILAPASLCLHWVIITRTMMKR